MGAKDMGRFVYAAVVLGSVVLAQLVQAAPVQGPNGNFYERIDDTLLWTDARNAAASRSYQGRSGRLATIPDSNTQSFILSNLRAGAPADCWFGATDEADEGEWRWLSGELFWTGGLGGSVVPGFFENWAANEPNNAGAGEDGAQMYSSGEWNDFFDTSQVGCYFVEYYADTKAVPIPPLAIVILGLLIGGLGLRRLSKLA